MRVIGTAGHVDHGKSTLVAALTGINPDRLKEEQEREMTIDLGFAWMTLPSGDEVGIVDVPGHRDFIENMLAGVGGIDAALLVIAADEGIMPQTREHLAILDLLQISAGLVVLTKIDLVDDPEWLDLVEADIRAALRGTALEDAGLVRVSSRTRIGLDKLIGMLDQLLHADTISGGFERKADLGRPRLPADRVFSVAGFGTVLTGTLVDGSFRTGDDVEVLPGGVRTRIRGLQTHKKNETYAAPGTRTAINLTGVDTEQVHRGDVVIHPGQYKGSRRVDVQVRILPDASAPLLHGDEVKFFIGTSETIARVRLLGAEVLKPGQTGWLQLELRAPIVAVRGDRFILRRPSPGETLGGGRVVDPHPDHRHKRQDPSILDRLESMSGGTPAEILLQASLSLGPLPGKELLSQSRLDPEKAGSALQELVETGQVTRLEDYIISTSHWTRSRDAILEILDKYHQDFPLRRGISREELKSRSRHSPRIFTAILKRLAVENLLSESNSLVFRPGHVINFTPAQSKAVRELMAQFSAVPYAPPGVKECQEYVGDDVFGALVDSGEMILVSTEVVFRREDYQTLVGRVRTAIQEKGSLTLADARDLLNTSRRYVQALLEHMDAEGITVREGETRRLSRRIRNGTERRSE